LFRRRKLAFVEAEVGVRRSVEEGWSSVRVATE